MGIPQEIAEPVFHPVQLQAQLKQMLSLIRSQQRQILEHQEALAEMHSLITTQVKHPFQGNIKSG